MVLRKGIVHNQDLGYDSSNVNLKSVTIDSGRNLILKRIDEHREFVRKSFSSPVHLQNNLNWSQSDTQYFYDSS